VDLSPAWYVDAWNVRDGAAFASFRWPEERDAANTVFICVPDLEPVPVGRRSTALSATRRHFQDGLRDPSGEDEIAFTDLDQVAELVRRGYLAGGFGPDAGAGGPEPGAAGDDDAGGAAAGQPVAPPGDGGSRGGAHYEAEVAGIGAAEGTWLGDHEVVGVLESLAETFDTLDGRTHPLLPMVTAYTQAVTIDWEDRLDAGDLRAGQLVNDWYDVQAWMGTLGDDPGEFAGRHHLNIGIHRFAWTELASWRPTRAWTLPQPSLSAIVHAAPCPLRLGWMRGLTRLSDKLKLPMCLTGYFAANDTWPALAPVLVGALTMTSLRVPTFGRDTHLDTRVATALRWLATQLARPLPVAAEVVLADYVMSTLDVPPPEPWLRSAP
jgi:hypothetical protein